MKLSFYPKNIKARELIHATQEEMMRPKPKSETRHVTRKPDGWAVVAPKSKSASGIYSTKREAVDAAKEILANQGGGAVRVHGTDGRIQQGINVRRGDGSRR